jgi:hypothetical protein
MHSGVSLGNRRRHVTLISINGIIEHDNLKIQQADKLPLSFFSYSFLSLSRSLSLSPFAKYE